MVEGRGRLIQFGRAPQGASKTVLLSSAQGDFNTQLQKLREQGYADIIYSYGAPISRFDPSKRLPIRIRERISQAEFGERRKIETAAGESKSRTDLSELAEQRGLTKSTELTRAAEQYQQKVEDINKINLKRQELIQSTPAARYYKDEEIRKEIKKDELDQKAISKYPITYRNIDPIYMARQRALSNQLSEVQRKLDYPIQELKEKAKEKGLTPIATSIIYPYEGLKFAMRSYELGGSEYAKLGTYGLFGESLLQKEARLKQELGIPLKTTEKISQYTLPISQNIPSGVVGGIALKSLGGVGTILGVGSSIIESPKIYKGIKIKETRPETVGSLIGFGIGFGAGSRINIISPNKQISLVRGARKIQTVLSPKFKEVKITPEGKKIVTVPRSTGSSIDIEILPRGLEKINVPLKEQIKVAGTTRDVVTAQRSLFGFLKKEIKVEKPKPTPSSPELERSLFTDITTRLRTSRLLTNQQPRSAGLKDILNMNFDLTRKRPQALLFESVVVEKLPKDIAMKIERGETLSLSQQKRLLKQQLTPTGKAKPIGFLSKEPELTIAPGETIKKEALIGRTIIEGEPVEIFRTKIVTLTKETQSLLKKDILSLDELKRLDKRLIKETGGLYRSDKTKPLLEISVSPPPSSNYNISPRISPKISQAPSPSVSSRPSPSPYLIPSPSPYLSPSPSPSPRPRPSPYLRTSPSPYLTPSPSPRPRPSPYLRTSPSPISRPPKIPKTPPPTYISKQESATSKGLTKKLKKVLGYQLFVKRKGKFKAIGGVTTRGKAIEAGARITRQTLARTFRIAPTKQYITTPDTPYVPSPQIYRRYKIKRGVKVPLEQEWIQRRKFSLGTRGEVQEIKAARRIKQSSIKLKGGFFR